MSEQLYAVEHGPADADAEHTVLAVHGVTANHECWRKLVADLPEHRVITPDLRGRAGSRDLPGPYGMARHADDLAALLRERGVDGPVTVVGHSMGGFVSVVLAHRHPELVRRLVLVDGGLPFRLPPGITVDQAIQATLGPAAERLTMTFPDLAAYLQLWRAHPAFQQHWDADLEAYLAHDLVGTPPELHPSTVVAAMRDDAAGLYDNAEADDGADDPVVVRAMDGLQHPTVFLRAERGLLDQPQGLYDVETVRRWQQRTGLETREVPGSNHYTIVMARPWVDAVTTAVKG